MHELGPSRKPAAGRLRSHMILNWIGVNGPTIDPDRTCHGRLSRTADDKDCRKRGALELQCCMGDSSSLGLALEIQVLFLLTTGSPASREGFCPRTPAEQDPLCILSQGCCTEAKLGSNIKAVLLWSGQIWTVQSMLLSGAATRTRPSPTATTQCQPSHGNEAWPRDSHWRHRNGYRVLSTPCPVTRYEHDTYTQ